MESDHIPFSNLPKGFPDLPVFIQNFSDFYMVRDDKLPFGFGTKWRKTSGILRETMQNGAKEILLWGAAHGNYLASFAYIFRTFGFFVETITYSKDPKLKTYNERLVTHHSHRMHCYANRNLAFEAFKERKLRFGGLVLPEFGIHPGQIPGLVVLWKELEKKIHTKLSDTFHTEPKAGAKAILLLEIGSGVSFVSAYDYFYNSPILVQGVMVGESKDSWYTKHENLQLELGLKKRKIPIENLIEILDENSQLEKRKELIENKKNVTQKKTRFARGQHHHDDLLRTFYEKNNILLEPIYSANSIHYLLKKQNENIEGVPKFPVFYLHQGGQIQHLNSVFPKPFSI
ncbi:1-aminocyclopropane-1-carboxylate deaminase [Leptospira sp. WS39.C2]